MKLRILLVVLLVLSIGAAWAAKYRNDKRNEFEAEYESALADYRARQFDRAEQRLKALQPDTEKWWASDIHVGAVALPLGWINRETDRLDQAEPYVDQAIAAYERAKVTDTNPDYSKALTAKGMILQERMEYNEAEKLYLRASMLLREIPNQQVPLGQAIAQVGSIAFERGDYEGAALMLTRAVDEFKSAGPVGDPYRAGASTLLAHIYDQQNKPKRADALYREVLSASINPSDPMILGTLADAAGYYAGEDRPAEARRAADKAMQAFETWRGPEIPPHIVARLASMLNQLNRRREAEELYLRSIQATERAHGPEHALVANLHERIGELYTNSQRYAQADAHLQKAVTIFEKARGPKHVETAEAVSQLSLLRYFQKKDAEAESLARRALPVLERALGAESVQVGMCLNRLALALEGQRKFSQAEATYKRSIAIREKAQGANHRGVATTLENLARTYAAQGKHSEAQDVLQRAYTIRGQYAGKSAQAVQ